MPAPVLFLGSGVAQYLGAAVAVGLFAVAGAREVAWLRILAAALVLLAWQRPWRVRWSRAALRGAAAFGLALTGMNVAFYLAIDHLPLGLAVALEFSGPVAVAAVTGRARERWGGLLAAAGVVVLSGAALALPGGEAVAGLAWIFAAAALWAGYIVLGRRVAQDAQGRGLPSLALGMAVGALVLAPFFAPSALPHLADGGLALAVLAVGVLSSVVPYAVEQVVLRRVTAATFAVLLALLPVTAVAVGAVSLQQVPSLRELLGVVLVCAAITLTSRRPAGPRSAGDAGRPRA